MGLAALLGSILNPLGVSFAVYLMGNVNLIGQVERMGLAELMESILNPLGVSYAVYLMGQGELDGAR